MLLIRIQKQFIYLQVQADKLTNFFNSGCFANSESFWWLLKLMFQSLLRMNGIVFLFFCCYLIFNLITHNTLCMNWTCLGVVITEYHRLPPEYCRSWTSTFLQVSRIFVHLLLITSEFERFNQLSSPEIAWWCER